jgi:hypothetical protein
MIILPSVGVRRHRLTLTDRPAIRHLSRPVARQAPTPPKHRHVALPMRWRARGASWGSVGIWAAVVLSALWVLLGRLPA